MFAPTGPFASCPHCDSPMEFDSRALASHIEAAHPDCSISPTGKHEWRQYTREIEWGNHDRGYRHRLAPHGFFCIHCPAKSDENRVITNPEAL